MNVKVTPIIIGSFGKILQELVKELGRLKNQRISGDHQNYSIKTGQNTKKSPGNLKRLAITHSPVRTIS